MFQFRVACSALLIAGVLLGSGCCQHLRSPCSPPGTIGYQRNQAVLHDPFPDNALGPAVVGGRPREFELPLPEVVSSQRSPFARPPSRQGGF